MTTQADKDGQFRRQNAQFRNTISRDPNAPFPAERDRYILYVNYGCPWAHRALIVRALKGLESVIELVVIGFHLSEIGWLFEPDDKYSAPKDPRYGFTEFRQLYWKADPEYNLRYTVPMLWDKKKETVVCNESAEIIRMLYEEFDELLEPEQREVNKPGGGLYPEHLRKEIDEMNEWVYHAVNNGVYKTGFASTQAAYEEHVLPLFSSLDRLEAHLATPPHGGPFLFGAHVTEADVRLYTTLIRFDAAYYTLFRCNLRMIRHDYPRLHAWLRRLYWDRGTATNGGAFGKTTYVDCFKAGYAQVQKTNIVPVGPLPDVMPWDEKVDGPLS